MSQHAGVPRAVCTQKYTFVCAKSILISLSGHTGLGYKQQQHFGPRSADQHTQEPLHRALLPLSALGTERGASLGWCQGLPLWFACPAWRGGGEGGIRWGVRNLWLAGVPLQITKVPIFCLSALSVAPSNLWELRNFSSLQIKPREQSCHPGLCHANLRPGSITPCSSSALRKPWKIDFLFCHWVQWNQTSALQGNCIPVDCSYFWNP